MKDLLSLDKGTLKTVISAVQEFSLYITLAIAAVLLIAFALIYVFKKDKMPLFKRVSVGVIIGYSVTLIAIILYLQIARMKVKGELDKNFFLFVGFFFTLIATVIIGFVLSVYAKKVYKYFFYIAFSVIIAYGIVLMCVIPTVETSYQPKEQVGFYILSALLIVAIFVLAFLFGKDNGNASQTKMLAYAGVCIALSFALSYVKLFSLPMGGSVTLASLLPLMLFSYMFGARKGVFAGVIYGVLQCLQNPQFYQPMQVLLDYPIAFGAIGLAGIAKKFPFLKGNMIAEFTVGMTIAVIFRYIAHVISGYYVFYTWSTMPSPVAYSFAYNSFTMVDLAIDLVLGILILISKNMRKVISGVNPMPNKISEADAQTSIVPVVPSEQTEQCVDGSLPNSEADLTEPPALYEGQPEIAQNPALSDGREEVKAALPENQKQLPAGKYKKKKK